MSNPTTYPSYDFGVTDFHGVVRQINNATLHEPEYLAAAYAIDSVKESGYEDSDNIDFHLGLLIAGGANFDLPTATKLALTYLS